MNLKNLKTTCCPICGESTVINEGLEISKWNKSEIRQHTNGTRWEKRTFLCGYTITYCPNFSRDEPADYTRCSNDPSIKERNTKRKIAHDTVVGFIENLEGVDKEFVEMMKHEIKSLSYKFKD